MKPGIVLLQDRAGEKIATGMLDPQHPIVVRVCQTQEPWQLNDDWAEAKFENAISLRESSFGHATTGMRLIAGEGDGLPGLIVDRYEDAAVMKIDGGAPQHFYHAEGIANWMMQRLKLKAVVLRGRGKRSGQVIAGKLENHNVWFTENGLKFSADLMNGQKTGFFLDQRDNRALIRQLARGKSVLNLFSFSGGFSVAAGIGQAKHVTSVDLASPAIEASKEHWKANGLSTETHEGVATDCFDFLGLQIKQGRQWDIVVCDPPSFAPSEQAKPNALAAYAKLASMAAKVTSQSGLLALASCSSHINAAEFAKCSYDGLGRARRKASLVAERGLPVDHPTPLAMPELKYLKFQLLQLD